MGFFRKVIVWFIDFFKSPKTCWAKLEIKIKETPLLFFLVLILIISLIIFIIYLLEWSNFITSLVSYLIHGNTYFYNQEIIFYNKAISFKNLEYPVDIINKSSTLKFLGAFLAGIIALITIVLSFRKFNQAQEQINKSEKQHKENLENTQKQISLTEENNLNTTFKDAVTLLGHENVSVRMGGVYTLIDIAKKNPDKYAKRINDILCQHLVDRSNIEYYEYLEQNDFLKENIKKFENINLLKSFYFLEKNTLDTNNLAKILNEHENHYYRYDLNKKKNIELNRGTILDDYFLYQKILKKIENYTSSNEVQLIINLLFIENSKTFSNYVSNLSNSKLFNIDINSLDYDKFLDEISKIHFKNAFLYNVKLSSNNINNLIFSDCILLKIRISIYSEEIQFYNSIIQESNFYIFGSKIFTFHHPSIIIGSKFHTSSSNSKFPYSFTTYLEKNYIYFSNVYKKKELIQIFQKLSANNYNIYFNHYTSIHNWLDKISATNNNPKDYEINFEESPFNQYKFGDENSFDYDYSDYKINLENKSKEIEKTIKEAKDYLNNKRKPN